MKSLFFGEGPERNHLQISINSQGLINHPEKELSNSNLYFHPTKYEPFGLVLIEVMAAGIPVITTDGQGNRDVVHEGSNGLFFYDRDPLAIANCYYFF